MMIVVTVMPEIGVTEIMAIAQAETVVNRNAITRTRMMETVVNQAGFGMSASTPYRKNTIITATARSPSTIMVP